MKHQPASRPVRQSSSKDIKRAWIPLKSELRNALFSTANRSRLDAPNMPSDVRADFATAICDEADLICDAL
ncbi:hypothetical protein ASE71_23980 [Ensifer sp. Root954]|nr:hypothetical protein ASD49_09515 [Ensifer sp. Root1298]KQX73291.1 hypothetical protein ASD41_09770 [Ensifer sp. Root1312]KRC16185.1 hypothetical protein ASE29_09575 [Ensifer sp. Root74]KRD70138.1 hypothetical protein ASE71_23980 [Ensifer sp. Root954]